ncbi:MAG TPA: hypothetical protein VIC34_06000 [Croceibacterium sp.]|jgi:hypothetical protein
MVPIQIKAQVLRRWPLVGHARTIGPFALVPDEGPHPPSRGESGDKGRWRQSDIKRAIAAAKQAGLESYRVEIAPDGTISIIVGAPSDTADPNSYDDLLRG